MSDAYKEHGFYEGPTNIISNQLAMIHITRLIITLIFSKVTTAYRLSTLSFFRITILYMNIKIYVMNNNKYQVIIHL